MTIDQDTDDRLEQRLRTACHAVIPHLADGVTLVDNEFADEPQEEWTLATVTPLTSTRTTGRARLVGVAAAALLVACGAGVWAATGRPASESTSAAETGSATPSLPSQQGSSAAVVSTVLAPSTGSSVPCFGADCTPVDRLPVVAGATDFYVGPESLGTPVVDQEMLDQFGIIRCVELTADGSACQRIEGIAGVGPVSYPTNVPAPSTVPGDITPRTIGIEIGTTYTSIAPSDYANIWGSGPTGSIAPTPLAVRGHDGIQYHDADRTYAVWQEQPGLLVWVAVPDQMADQLSTIAEGVRRVSGPATIPYVVVVTPLARPWDTSDNSADGLVYTRIGGKLQVGVDYVDGTSPVVVRQNPNVDGELVVGGAAPTEAMQVRITTAGNPPVIIDTVAFAGAPEARFFQANVPGGVGQVTFAWLAADGSEIDTGATEAVQADVQVDTTVAHVGG
jgi:hypothetical protein